MKQTSHFLIKILIYTVVMFFSQSHAAMHLSDTGMGQVGIVPFYSVANDLNTLVSVTNNTDRYKAVRVSIRESKSSVSVLNKHVYLSPNDTWSAALAMIEGRPSLLSTDNSCDPFTAIDPFPGIEALSGNGIEVEEGEISEEELVHRMQTGHIEVYDLGDLVGFQDFVIPNEGFLDCALIQAAWIDGGVWAVDSTDGISNPTGGISILASLIQVESGFAVDIDATLFQNFYASDLSVHGTPEQIVPDLSSAQNNSMLIHEGQVISSEWATGYEAVGALLNQVSVSSDFNVYPVIAGETELVLSFPTKRYHIESDVVTAPFSDTYTNSDNDICATSFLAVPSLFVNSYLFGRDGEMVNLSFHGDPSPPPFSWLCEAVNVTKVLSLGGSSSVPIDSLLTNNMVLYLYAEKSEGVFKISFPEFTTTSNGTSTTQYTGLPVLGFAIQKYQNAAAQPGLLAAYTSAAKHRSERLIEILDPINY